MSSFNFEDFFDTCPKEEKLYTFGSYIDLCGMSVEDALKNLNSCPCGNNSSDTTDSGSTKIENTLYLTLEETA